jgi:hypothetical protein
METVSEPHSAPDGNSKRCLLVDGWWSVVIVNLLPDSTYIVVADVNITSFSSLLCDMQMVYIR